MPLDDPRLLVQGAVELLDGWCGPVLTWSDEHRCAMPGVLLERAPGAGPTWRVYDLSAQEVRALRTRDVWLSAAEPDVCCSRIPWVLFGLRGRPSLHWHANADRTLQIGGVVVAITYDSKRSVGAQRCPELLELDPRAELTTLDDGTAVVAAAAVAAVARRALHTHHTRSKT